MRLTGQEAAKTLLANQWVGLSNAIEAGLIVKVNSVYLPGVNDEDLAWWRNAPANWARTS